MGLDTTLGGLGKAGKRRAYISGRRNSMRKMHKQERAAMFRNSEKHELAEQRFGQEKGGHKILNVPSWSEIWVEEMGIRREDSHKARCFDMIEPLPW